MKETKLSDEETLEINGLFDKWKIKLNLYFTIKWRNVKMKDPSIAGLFQNLDTITDIMEIELDFSKLKDKETREKAIIHELLHGIMQMHTYNYDTFFSELLLANYGCYRDYPKIDSEKILETLPFSQQENPLLVAIQGRIKIETIKTEETIVRFFTEILYEHEKMAEELANIKG